MNHEQIGVEVWTVAIGYVGRVLCRCGQVHSAHAHEAGEAVDQAQQFRARDHADEIAGDFQGVLF